jgi:predicted secreted protein
MSKTISVSAALFLLASCSNPALEFEKASGKFNRIKNGQKFSVLLPEDHTTHYYWTLKDSYDRNKVQYMGSVFHGQNSKQVEFRFQAAQSGRTELGFQLFSYRDTAEVKTFLVEVE